MQNETLLLKIILTIITLSTSDLLPKEEKIDVSLIECLVTIIKSNEDNYFKMAIFSSEEYLKTTTEILKRTLTPVTINADEQYHETAVDTREPTNVVFVFNKTIEPSIIINNVLWYSDTKFFVIIYNKTKLDYIFEQFWSHQLINVFILLVKNTHITLYTLKPFTPEKCGKVEVKYIDRWENGRFLQNGLSIIRKPVRLINFNKCPVNISTMNSEPNTIFYDCNCPHKQNCRSTLNNCQKSNHTTLTFECVDGMEGKIMVEIAKKLNYTPTYVIPEADGWGWIKPEPAGLVRHVYLGKSLIGFGLLAPTLERFQALDISVPSADNECVTYGVPKGVGPKRPYWLDFLTEFPIEIWLALAASYITVGFILLAALQHRRKEFCVFHYSFGVMLQVSSRLPKRLPIRILVISWCWCTFILTIAYQTSMGSSLTVPKSDPDINTFKELLATDLKIVGFETGLRQLKYDGNDGEIQELAKRYIIINEQVDVIVDKMILERDIAHQRAATPFLYYILTHPKARNEVHVLEECVYSFYPCLMLKKRSPLTERINKIVYNLKEMGIIEYWISLYITNIPPTHYDFVKLSLCHIKGLFYIVLVGYGSAMLCLAIELLCENLCFKCCKEKNN